jgi:putative transposase
VASRGHGDGESAYGRRSGGPQSHRPRKKGVTRSLVVEAAGGPLGATIAGANVHDTKLLSTTLGAIVVERPQPTAERPQHRCLDKGDDHPTGHETVLNRTA